MSAFGTWAGRLEEREPCSDPDCRICPEERELAALLRRAERLEAALGWTFAELCDGADADAGETPEHTCDFTHDPEKGRCEFHEKFFDAWALLAEPAGAGPGTSEEE